MAVGLMPPKGDGIFFPTLLEAFGFFVKRSFPRLIDGVSWKGFCGFGEGDSGENDEGLGVDRRT